MVTTSGETMLIARLADAEPPIESVTCTLKIRALTVVGVPVMAPDDGLRAKPGGRDPFVTFAVSVWEYATPSAPPGSEVITMVSPGPMVMAIVTWAVRFPKSDNCTVNCEVPLVVGVPEMVPVLLKNSPAGRLPLRSEKV